MDWTRKHDQEVCQTLRDEHGLERTPGEVSRLRREALQAIRERALGRGIILPADDWALLRYLRGVWASGAGCM